MLNQDNFGFLLVGTARLMRREFQARLENGCLTLAKAKTLIHIALREGIRQVELADLLEVKPITLTRMLDQLVRDGLVERRSDPDDRRVFRLHLLDAAKSHLDIIESIANEVRAKALAGLDEKQQEAMLGGLRQVRNNLSDR